MWKKNQQKKILSALVIALLFATFISDGSLLAQETGVAMLWHYPSEADINATQYLDITSPNWFNLNANLGINDTGYSNYVSEAHAKGLKVVPRLAGLNSTGWGNSIFGTAVNRQTIINNLNVLVAKYKNQGTPLDGINLDFEAIGSTATSSYTQFVQQLAADVKSLGMSFSIDVPGITSYTGTDGTYTGGFDFAALGQISQVDYIAIMAYDWTYGAPKYYVQDTLTYATKYIPQNKILLGVPLYSRDYVIDPSGQQTPYGNLLPGGKYYYADAMSRINQPGANAKSVWDSYLGLTRVTYTSSDGKQHLMFLEDSVSLKAKMDVANQFGVAGIAGWRYDKVDPNIWAVIGKELGKTPYTAIWNFSSNGITVTPSLTWNSSPNSFLWDNTKSVAGDFNGDGRHDIAVLYNYGNNTAGLWMFTSNGNSSTPQLAWKSNASSFSWANSKLVSGDFNGDGKDDVAVVYNYGNNTTGIWEFLSEGQSFKPFLAWKSTTGSFSWTNSKVTAADYNGDGKDDIGILYNYGNNTSGVWTFMSTGKTLVPKLAWSANKGSFNWQASQIVSGDLNGDKKADVDILYNYGNNTSGIWTFISDGQRFTPRLAWKSSPGSFAWSNSKIVSTDFNGDHNDDVGVLYNYGSGNSGLWTFISNKSSLSPQLAWRSDGYAWDKSLFLSGDFNGDGKYDYQILYNYTS